MLKGVNRQILEVNNTENEYFEKVLFFVKPEYSNMNDKKLSFEAEMYSKGEGKPPAVKRKKLENFKTVLKMLLSAVSGAVLAIIFMNIA